MIWRSAKLSATASQTLLEPSVGMTSGRFDTAIWVVRWCMSLLALGLTSGRLNGGDWGGLIAAKVRFRQCWTFTEDGVNDWLLS